MNDKEFNALRKRFQVLIKRWVGPLGLGWWRLNFTYHRELTPTDVSQDGKREALGTCKANWQYREAEIIFNMPACADLKDDELERMFVHELMHVFLNEARQKDVITPGEESAASALASAFIWHREELLKVKKRRTQLRTTTPALPLRWRFEL